MNLQERLPKGWRQKKWFWVLISALVAIVIIVIVVPIAVVFSRRAKAATEFGAMLLVPLYIYPSSSAWAPMYNAIVSHPTHNFTVIVNPNSGPGDSSLPGNDYYTAIQKLNSYDNVRTVGYVRTNYTKRDITDVIDDVKTYAGWSENSTSIGMSGIFFDEAVYEYNADSVTYMNTIDEIVKNATGIMGSKTIIHNPGTIPDDRYNNDNVDITVVFEDSYTAWQSKKDNVTALSDARQRNSIMINSVPSLSDNDLKTFVEDLAKMAEYLFLTSNTEDFYESFASDWPNVVDVTNTTNT